MNKYWMIDGDDGFKFNSLANAKKHIMNFAMQDRKRYDKSFILHCVDGVVSSSISVYVNTIGNVKFGRPEKIKV